jgi:hypothetical protein
MVPQRIEPGPQARQLLEVGAGQGLDPRLASLRQPQPDDPLVVVVGHPRDQAGGDGSIDEPDDAVVAEQQVIGDLTDRRGTAVAADGEQKLMLGGREPDIVGLLLAPVQEPPQPVPEREQPAEVFVSQRSDVSRHIGVR